MWPLLLGLWKARRGRKAAVAAIAPLVERSRQRLNGIPDAAWLDPYLVGFMITFITLVARREVNALDSQALGLVQCSAWGDITGMKAELVGEETLHCCELGDRDFECGCRDAVTVDLALYRGSFTREADRGEERNIGVDEVADIDAIMALWEEHFDAKVLYAASRRDATEPQPCLGGGA